MKYKHILQIDDDEEDLEIFASALSEVSPAIELRGISRALEALAALRSGEVQPDLIILDLNMPVMSGHDFLREIKKDDQLQAIPVIAFSTTSQRATIDQTLALGAADFITKPNGYGQLVQALRSLLT